MRTAVYWIDGPWRGRLAVAARPRGGDWLGDEIATWRAAGIDAVVSLLTPDEVAELELTDEATLCETFGLQYVPFPIPDRATPPSHSAVRDLVRTVERTLVEGKGVLVHCRQGVGRSPLIAACVLVAAGATPDAAFARIAAARGTPVPETRAQRAWTERFARDWVATVREP